MRPGISGWLRLLRAILTGRLIADVRRQTMTRKFIRGLAVTLTVAGVVIVFAISRDFNAAMAAGLAVISGAVYTSLQ